MSLVSYSEFPEMLLAAQKGDIRVFVEDVGATLYRLKKSGLVDEFRYNRDRVLYRNNFWIAVREGDSKLARNKTGVRRNLPLWPETINIHRLKPVDIYLVRKIASIYYHGFSEIGKGRKLVHARDLFSCKVQLLSVFRDYK